MRCADAVLLHLRAHLEALCAGRDHERRLPSRAQLGVHRRDHDVHVRDAAVRGPRLLPVQDPVVCGLVVPCPRAQGGDVRSGVGLGYAEGAHLWVVGGPVALRHPFHQLLRSPGGEDPGHGERRPHDRHADAGVAPEELLVDDRQGQPRGVCPELRQALERVQPDLRRLLDHGPGGLLPLVPFRGRRPHDSLRKAVHPVTNVLLVLRELERERGPVVAWVGGAPPQPQPARRRARRWSRGVEVATAAAHVQPHDAAGHERTHLDEVAQLVRQPQPVSTELAPHRAFTAGERMSKVPPSRTSQIR